MLPRFNTQSLYYKEDFMGSILLAA